MTTKVSWMPPRAVALTAAGLAVAFGAYWLWWQYSASILQKSLNDFRNMGSNGAVYASWNVMTLSGFPMRLRAALEKPDYQDRAVGLRWTANGLAIETLPWSLSQVSFQAFGPQKLALSSGLSISGEAKESGVSLLFRKDGMPRQVDVAAEVLDAKITDGNDTVTVKGKLLAAHWRIDPADAELKDGRDYNVALNGQALTLTGVPLPFGQVIQDLVAQITLRGIPALNGVDGAMDVIAWGANGAPVTVQKLSFVSGGVDVKGAGELRLDANSALEGQLNLTIGGLDKIVAYLSAQGALPPEAKSTLIVTSTMLSAGGAKLPIPLVFKDGKTFLGPAQIGPAPRFVK